MDKSDTPYTEADTTIVDALRTAGLGVGQPFTIVDQVVELTFAKSAGGIAKDAPVQTVDDTGRRRKGSRVLG